MKIQVAVFLVVTLCSEVEDMSILEDRAIFISSETVVSYHLPAWCHNPEECDLKAYTKVIRRKMPGNWIIM